MRFFRPLLYGFVIILTFLFFYLRTNAAPLFLKPGSFPSHPEIEERFGVRFTSVNMTAQNGLVDLRYKVVDLGKATNFGHYTETTPMLINERTRAVIDVMVMGAHNHRVELGRIYYVLYRNTGNAFKPGDKLTIQMDDMTVQHITLP